MVQIILVIPLLIISVLAGIFTSYVPNYYVIFGVGQKQKKNMFSSKLGVVPDVKDVTKSNLIL